ncbi:amino acid permease C-terminal domain-containing protein [Streptomyces sp. M10(2022)]
MLNLPAETWVRFAVWMALGMIIYLAYGRRNSRISNNPE